MEDIPLHHRVFDRLFYDVPTLALYGTSHAKEISAKDGNHAEEKRIEGLEDDIYQERKSFLIKHVGCYFEGETLTGWAEDVFHDLFLAPTPRRMEFYFTHKHSPATISLLLPAYERVKREMDVASGQAFFQAAFSLKDYVVNTIVPHHYLFDMRGNKAKRSYSHPLVKNANDVFERTTERADAIINQQMKELNKHYLTPRNQSPTYEADPSDSFYTLLPEGTRLYRGYKQKYGSVNVTRDYSYFVTDPATCFVYAQPSGMDLGEEAVNLAPTNTTTQMYCKTFGGVVEVETMKATKLINLSTSANVVRLRNEMKEKNAPAAVQAAFQKGWVITPTDAFLRVSETFADGKVIDWLCKNGYAGYMGIHTEGLHDEIVFCNLRDVVRIRKEYGAKDFNLPLCNEPYVSLSMDVTYW